MVAPEVARRVRRVEVDAPLPYWPVGLMFAAFPLWFVLGLSGFMWVILAMPMAASLIRRRNLVVPKGSGWWLVFMVAVVGSVLSIDTVPRLSGWVLRFGYYIAAAVLLLYILNGRNGVDVWRVVRSLTILWMAVVVGGYLAFVVGELSFRAPLYYVMPAALLENELIEVLVTPSFAQVQDIIGFPVPRPKAPFNYTNGWGSMLALLTPFAFISLYDKRVGLPHKLIRLMMMAAVVPAIISLNRGLWLSLGVGLVYAAIRFGAAGEKKLVIQGLWGILVLAVVLYVTPLGGLITTRLETPHSNADRATLAIAAIEGAAERPLFGWGAPRPNERLKLPSVGTHGQIWFALFSHGFVGLVGFFGTMVNLAVTTRKQHSTAGIWAHVTLIIGLTQMPFYLMMPDQLFTMFAAAAVALRLQREVEPGLIRTPIAAR